MTRPRQENQAITHLKEQAFSVYLPIITKRDRLGREIGFEPLFPGYCFCSASRDQSLAPMRSTPGVLSPVSFGQQIAYLDEATIDRIRLAESYLAETATRRPLEPGDKVAIIDGPLAGLEGLASKIRKERVEVLVGIMGQPQRLKCNRAQLAKV